LLRENPNSTLLFLSERKGPLSIDGAQKLVERLGEAAGFAFPIHAHLLRHSAGYALAGRAAESIRAPCRRSWATARSPTPVIYTAVADKRIRNVWGK
jgi:type 1 fimbriae regulatory protein FimB/type 1 fimbriae regulatory protein FimE